MAKRALWAGVALIVLSNAVVLGKIWHNRSGVPESQVILTERELMPPWLNFRNHDDSGITLQLHWRFLPPSDPGREGYVGWSRPDWLNAAKLRELEVTLPRNPDDNDSPQPHKEVILVLEMNGPAYQASVQRVQQAVADAAGKADKLKEAQESLQHELTESSRLFAIDAGLNAAALRARYPDRQRYVLIKGRVSGAWSHEADGVRYYGVLHGLQNQEIHVPHAWMPVARGKHFQLQLAFGQQLEPWVVSGVAGSR